MNYLKALRRVPVKLYQPETLDYRDRVVAAGGSMTVATLDSIEKFVRDCKEAGLWSRLLEVCPFAGSDLTSALVKLVRPNGVANSLTNVNFVAGDYSETGVNGGLNGNGTTKYLNTGFNIQTHLPDNAHMSFYLRDDVGGAANVIAVGAISGSDQYWAGALNPASQVHSRFGQLTLVTGSGGLTKGFYVGSRTAANSLKLYRNGAQVGADSNTVTHTKLNYNAFVFAYNNGSAAGGFLAGRLAFYSIGHGLTETETLAFHEAVRTLQRNLDRSIN
jgi:hypothetical protein